MRFLYTLVICLLFPFVLLRLFILGLNNPAYHSRWPERFGFYNVKETDQKIVWLHAVSVGEVNAAAPIISRLIESYSRYRVLVTTVTPTGAATVRQQFADNVLHCYLPYDLPFSVTRFINNTGPALLLTMETEIWPNLYYACNRAAIPILIINARLSEKSAGRYRLVSALTAQTLRRVDLIAAQTERDALRFIALGAAEAKVCVCGNLKFDITLPKRVLEQAASLQRDLSSVNRPVWIAASTHAGEEDLVLSAHKNVLKNYPNAILILAPRHPERIKKITALCKKFDLTYLQRTARKPFPADCSVYLLDILGELKLHYAVSQLAFVGGSLVNTGGQNMLEPASLGLPVLSGPHTYNFVEITELLVEKGVLFIISNAEQLADHINMLFAEPDKRHSLGEKAREVIEANKGNIDQVMDKIEAYLSD